MSLGSHASQASHSAKAPTDTSLKLFYDFVKGREKEAFAILRKSEDLVIPVAAPLLKAVLGDTKATDPIPDNKPANKKAESAFEKLAAKGYVEDQKNPACEAIKVGVANLNWGGCGIIATYNLVKSLGRKTSIVDLVEHFEAEGIMVKGEFGTDPWMIEQYLKQRGFKTKQIPATDQSAVTHVLTTFWNDKDTITGSAHTICLTREADGRLHSHNHYDRETYATVKDFYAKHPKVSPIVVFSVSK